VRRHYRLFRGGRRALPFGRRVRIVALLEPPLGFVGYPEDRDEAERRLQEGYDPNAATEEEGATAASE
jgi:hypothetical protein